MVSEVDDKVVTIEVNAEELDCGYILPYVLVQLSFGRAQDVNGSDSAQ